MDVVDRLSVRRRYAQGPYFPRQRRSRGGRPMGSYA